MQRSKLRLALLLVATTATLVWACGPEFFSLLHNRKQELARELTGDFFFAARQLVPAPATPFPQDPAASHDKNYVPPEYVGLSATQAETVRAMRAAADGDAAYALGAALAPALRAYTAAAVDYQRAKQGDDDSGKALPRAAQRFASVLQLNANEAKLRSVWAAYSLGLTYSLMGGDEALAHTDKYFALTRKLAQDGAPDPQYLAIESFGAQALEHLNAGHISRAMELYAEQAAHQSTSGIQSLSLVSKKLLDSPALLQAHIGSPIVQKAVLAYVLAYGDDNVAADAGLRSAAPAQADHKASRLQVFTTALAAAGIDDFADSDKLAATAYRYGHYDATQRYAGNAVTPLAHWLRGKLALRAGKLNDAAAHFAKAVQASQTLGAGKDGLRVSDRARLMAESATLQLGRGDFLQAFDRMYQVGGRYWLDLAYLAERVLTAEELKAYVDQHVPAIAPPTEKELERRMQDPDADVQWPATDINAQLRDLLARRLMREGQFAQALPYFHTAGPPHYADADTRKRAKDYAGALQSAERAWTAVGRAKSLYEAARLARWNGMEIMGYELGPDYFVMDGNYEAGTPQPRHADLATTVEINRHLASAARTEKRFHYRYTATALAMRAADQLPRQSAAYAQVLDNATSWLIDRDPEEAAKIYQHYVAHGPLLHSDKRFGRSPDEPQFWQAYQVQVRQMAREARLWARGHKPMAWALITLGGAGLAAMAWLARKRYRR